MENLSVHRLRSFDEILSIREQDPQRFDLFTHKVYTILLKLLPGRWFSLVEVDQESRPVFVKVACMAIQEGMDLEFSEDFNRIRRTIPAEPLRIKLNKPDEDEKGE